MKLTEEAKKKLTECYAKLIELSSSEKGFLPVGPRTLENLIRLTLARAKVELRRVATCEDVEDVEDLVYEALLGSLAVENGSKSYEEGLLKARKIAGVDLNSKSIGHLSKAKQLRVFLHNVKQMADQNGPLFHESKLVELCRRLSMDVGEDYRDYIHRLNMQGLFLQQGNRNWKFMGLL